MSIVLSSGDYLEIRGLRPSYFIFCLKDFRDFCDLSLLGPMLMELSLFSAISISKKLAIVFLQIGRHLIIACKI
jgi:hypothetical protein